MDGERAVSTERDVVCLGESMALFVPSGPAREWRQTVGGAESNVACHLAGAGLRSRWVSALGDDPFGQSVLDSLAGAGVDTTDVRRDPERPTGVYFKDSAPAGGRVSYYRSGSAATALGPELIEDLDLSRTALLHLTGITPALSDRCRALVDVLTSRRSPDVRMSFDVNWRAALWRSAGVADPPGLLRDLANRADVVFVGADEAEAVWGVSSVAEIRALLPEPRSLVVKHGARGATLVEEGAEEFEPALEVDVVEPVGAGDAFAAGFLAAALRGGNRRHRLRAGHLRAAAVLCTSDDVAPPLDVPDLGRMLDADLGTWESITIRGGRVVG